MTYICFVTCFISTLLGAISGIGGGVLIKPALDLLLPLSMSRISFLSSCAVLCMAVFSVVQNYLRKDGQALNSTIAVPFVVGGTLGGIAGKTGFNWLASLLNADNIVKVVQNSLLAVLMLSVLILTPKLSVKGEPVKRGALAGVLISFTLGLAAAFLGIGGGPLNMLALTALYGLTHKESALYSLFIIAFSQTAGLSAAVISHSELPPTLLIIAACAAGVLGGIVGRQIAKKIANETVRALFSIALFVIIAICAVNVTAQFV